MNGVQPTKDLDATGLIYNPAQIGRVGTGAIKARMENRDKGIGVPFGIPDVDRVFYPLLPAELVFFIARPGNGKTGVMSWWARERAKNLAAGRAPDAQKRVVVYVSYEQLIEELHLYHVASDEGVDVERMARGNLNDSEYLQVVNAGARRSAYPLWYVGLSNENRMTQPEMTLPYLWSALEAIENGGERIIDCVFVDYLHAMPLPPAESKVVALDQLVLGMKMLGRRFAAPVISGAQARREVDGYSVQVPNEGDAQWCSAIEQRADRVIGLVRPRKYCQEGDMFGQTLVSGHYQLLFYIWKQRFAKANEPVWLEFIPEHNQINPSSMKTFSFSKPSKQQTAFKPRSRELDF